MISFIGEYKPYDNGSYNFIDKNKVKTNEGVVKYCEPFKNLLLLGYSKIVHWSLIENCKESLPRFYAIYPYAKKDINELIFMDNVHSRDFKDSYKYYEQGDLIAFKNGIYQYVNPLLGILPVTDTRLTENLLSKVYNLA